MSLTRKLLDALDGSFGSPSVLNRFVVERDGRLPTQGENDALSGTRGTPGYRNRFVTNSDPRNTNARTPTGAAGGDLDGTYPDPTVQGGRILTADPAAPANDTWWIVREGSSPEVAYLRIRVGGVTYQLASADLV